MAIINVGDRNVKEKKVKKTKEKSKKPKKDIKAIVHKGCRTVIYRTIEYAIIFFVTSIAVILVGNGLIPILAYDTASGLSLTQSTHIYNALTNWGFSMLFYVILLAIAAFAAFKRFVTKLHAKFTDIINRPEIHTTEESAAE